jgi:hypothetical protein
MLYAAGIPHKAHGIPLPPLHAVDAITAPSHLVPSAAEAATPQVSSTVSSRCTPCSTGPHCLWYCVHHGRAAPYDP